MEIANTKPATGVQSVEVAGRILKALTAEGGKDAQLKTIANRSQLHSAKAHRYLVSLIRTGLAAQDPASGLYKIGPLAIEMGLIGLTQNSPLQLITSELPKLRDEVRETVVLAVWSELGPTVVAIEEARAPLSMNVKLGTKLPATSTAIGHVFLADLPKDQIGSTLELDKPDLAPEDRKKALKVIQVHMDTYRKTGIAVTEGSLLPDVNAIAAAIKDQRGRAQFAVGIVGPAKRLMPHPDSDKAKALSAWSSSLTMRLQRQNFNQS